MASTDLTKAFHQVSVEAILTGARRAGFSSKFVRHIKDLYTNSRIILQFQGETLGVQPTTDVRQGDTLSPVLFNLVLDEYFTNVDLNIGFVAGDLRLDATAFADDLVVFASTPQVLQLRLNQVQDFFMPRGLRVNIKKSFTLSMQPSGREKKLKISTDNIFTVAGSPLPTSEVTTLWRYLGVTFSPQGTKNMGLRTQLQELLTRVSKAPLRPQQRLVILRFHLLPRLYHRLVLGPWTNDLLRKMDASIRGPVRRWLNLPHNTPLGFSMPQLLRGASGSRRCEPQYHQCYSSARGTCPSAATQAARQ